MHYGMEKRRFRFFATLCGIANSEVSENKLIFIACTENKPVTSAIVEKQISSIIFACFPQVNFFFATQNPAWCSSLCSYKFTGA